MNEYAICQIVNWNIGVNNMGLKLRSVGIIGVGHVGAHCAYSLAVQGIVDELILVDINREKLVSEKQDLVDSVAHFPHRVTIKTGEYKDLSNCDIIVISVGGITQDQNRLSELKNSVSIVESFVGEVVSSGFDGIFIVITNPCDIVTRQVHKLSGFDSSRVIGTGTSLDSARFRQVLARETGVDHKSIIGYTMGEHGDSQMIPWSHISVNGKPILELAQTDSRFALDYQAVLQEVVDAGWKTYKGKGATEYGIASALARIVNCIFHDEKQVLPVSTQLNGQYGQTNLFTSVPAIIGKDGVEGIFELNLTEEEMDAFNRSCEVLRDHIKMI